MAVRSSEVGEQPEESAQGNSQCQDGDVGCLAPNGHAEVSWQCPLLGHETDMPTTLRDVRFQGQSGKHMLASSFSGFDPTRTLAVHCGNGLDAGFSPYQNTRLSR
jgi:hypothetical protein